MSSKTQQSQPSVQRRARQEITRVIESWSIAEPLLFSAWTSHDVVEQPRIQTIRVGQSKVEFNAAFIASLKRADLRDVLKIEAMRILLGHPYSRKRPSPELSYLASNLTVQEYLRTRLNIPRPRELFADENFDNQYFEFYYQELSQRAHDEPTEEPSRDQPNSNESETDTSKDESTEGSCDNHDQDLPNYTDHQCVGSQNAATWDQDDLQLDEIESLIREADATNQWGSIAGSTRERLVANLATPLDYPAILAHFRQTVSSTKRRLTRMKPSRRYGFDQMGSRYEMTTRLLFAVDVSGSIQPTEMATAFSIINQFFRYGIQSIDVVTFDTIIQGERVTLKRAQKTVNVTGRGGTDFQCIFDLIDQTNCHDGVIIYTDGQAPIPRTPPRFNQPKVLWLLKNKKAYDSFPEGLASLGMTTFIP